LGENHRRLPAFAGPSLRGEAVSTASEPGAREKGAGLTPFGGCDFRAEAGLDHAGSSGQAEMKIQNCRTQPQKNSKKLQKCILCY